MFVGYIKSIGRLWYTRMGLSFPKTQPVSRDGGLLPRLVSGRVSVWDLCRRARAEVTFLVSGHVKTQGDPHDSSAGLLGVYP